MLIDTNRLDRLRVNFISEFQTATNAENARTDVETLIDSYPAEMTTEIRQWLPEAPLSSPFREALLQLENDVRLYQQNPSKVKVKEEDRGDFHHLLRSFDSLPSPPEHFTAVDRQRYLKIKTQLDHIRRKHSAQKSPMDQSIETIDRLIQRIRESDEQLQRNVKEPIVDYENLLVDCQVRWQRVLLLLLQRLSSSSSSTVENSPRDRRKPSDPRGTCDSFGKEILRR